jgi:hypothetical protein
MLSHLLTCYVGNLNSTSVNLNGFPCFCYLITLDHLRINNQQDASSIQNFILSRNSTCFVTKLNFGYLMHLVGYLYEDYHDARSLEHKERLISCTD